MLLAAGLSRSFMDGHIKRKKSCGEGDTKGQVEATDIIWNSNLISEIEFLVERSLRDAPATHS